MGKHRQQQRSDSASKSLPSVAGVMLHLVGNHSQANNLRDSHMSEINQTESKRGGKRTGAGRPKGAASKKTREIADKAAEGGITPLEFMLWVMRQDYTGGGDDRSIQAHFELRFEAAKAAAPYIHPKLQAVEHTGQGGGPVQLAAILQVVGVESKNAG